MSFANIPSILKLLTFSHKHEKSSSMMKTFLRLLFNILFGSEKTTDLALENLALRQQVAIMKRSAKRPRLRNRDRLFWILYVLVVLSHNRRRVVHFNVALNPTARWTAQQIIEAFAWDTAPMYLIEFPRVGGLHHRYQWREAA